MDRMAKQFKGVALEAIKAVVEEMKPSDNLLCQMLKKGENEKQLKLIKVYNKGANEATKLSFGLITALAEGLKPDTKMTIPDVLWSVI